MIKIYGISKCEISIFCIQGKTLFKENLIIKTYSVYNVNVKMCSNV